MSGINIEGQNIQIDDEFVSYDYNVNGEQLHNKLEKYRVFSITDENKQENIIYQQDSTEGRYFSIDEMRTFIVGEQDAKKYFKSPQSTIIAGAVGIANGLVFGPISPILSLPGAFIIGFGTSLIPSKIKTDNPEKEKLLKEFPYHDGYKRVGKSKKVRNGLLGAVGGTAIGIITSIIVF